MRTCEINAKGKVIEREVLRKDIAEEFEIHSRDLRPVLSIKQLSTISPRGNAIIINAGEIKMLIGKQKVFVFNILSEQISDELIPGLAVKLQNLLKDDRTAFEFIILEHALTFALQKFREEFEKHEKNVQKTLYKLKSMITDQHFEGLLNIKKNLSKLQTKVQEMEEATEETIKDEEDIQAMCLSNPEATTEAESILEHVWEQFEDLAHQIRELNENIDDTQEIITLKMANRRNVIIRFDLVATMITAVLSGLAVVVGVFGMNLKNTFEESTPAFFTVVLFSGGFFVFSFVALWWYLKKKKIW